jgi:hypothetical protein
MAPAATSHSLARLNVRLLVEGLAVSEAVDLARASDIEPLDAALDMIQRGWNPVPVRYRDKAPAVGKGWQNVVITTENAAKFFNGAHMNVGVMLGPTSQGLVDIDLDCQEAIEIAPYILPRTAIFGRASKRNSHWLYVCYSLDTGTAVVAYDDPLAKTKRKDGRIVELRVGGPGHAAQTVVPPSIHQSGEPIRWEVDGEPASIDGARLQYHVATIASYALLARYWPSSGSGCHDAAKVVGGFLSRLGLSPIQIRTHVEAIAKASSSAARWKELSRTAGDASEAHASGGHAFGMPGMRDVFDTKIADRVARWLGYEGDSSARDTSSITAGAELLPQIKVTPGDLPNVVSQAEKALMAAGCDIYQRGGALVRPVLARAKAADGRETRSWRVAPISRPYAVDVLTRAAIFTRYNVRSASWVPIDAPDKVADLLLAREGEWQLPMLSGITTTPFLRVDGSLCDQPGYDAASGVLLRPSCAFPSIPGHPSREDAIEALRRIDATIAGFPFTDQASRSVALSAFLTAIDRRAMTTAPLHALTAPMAGTGKSLLVDAVALLATGRAVPVISQGHDEIEMEKRLSACLLAGDLLISIDNCTEPLGGAFLCQSLTQNTLNIRLLGHSRTVETPNNALMFATGNNLRIDDDACRRVLLCSLDARCERPEVRRFDFELSKYILQHRPALVGAILTILRAWHQSGVRMELEPLGSFDSWSHRVREALIWLDRADPVDTMIAVRAGDPVRESLAAVVFQWEACLGTSGEFTIKQVIERAANASEFRDALCIVAGQRGHESVICPMRLGRYLKKNEGKIVGGLTLRCSGNTAGYMYWELERV